MPHASGKPWNESNNTVFHLLGSSNSPSILDGQSFREPMCPDFSPWCVPRLHIRYRGSDAPVRQDVFLCSGIEVIILWFLDRCSWNGHRIPAPLLIWLQAGASHVQDLVQAVHAFFCLYSKRSIWCSILKFECHGSIGILGNVYPELSGLIWTSHQSVAWHRSIPYSNSETTSVTKLFLGLSRIMLCGYLHCSKCLPVPLVTLFSISAALLPLSK